VAIINNTFIEQCLS